MSKALYVEELGGGKTNFVDPNDPERVRSASFLKRLRIMDPSTLERRVAYIPFYLRLIIMHDPGLNHMTTHEFFYYGPQTSRRVDAPTTLGVDFWYKDIRPLCDNVGEVFPCPYKSLLEVIDEQDFGEAFKLCQSKGVDKLAMHGDPQDPWAFTVKEPYKEDLWFYKSLGDVSSASDVYAEHGGGDSRRTHATVKGREIKWDPFKKGEDK